MTSENPSYSIKYIIIGDSGVGKSNILLRYSKDKFDPNHRATLGIEFVNKRINFKGTNYTIQIWDTAGQEDYKSITRGYYKSSACAFIVYDITKLITFKNIENWIKDCLNLSPKNIQLVLIGNKSDLEENREVEYDMGKNFADENNMIFFETSAFQRIYFACYDNIILIPYKNKFNELLSNLLISICQYQRESNDVEMMKHFLNFILNNKNPSNHHLQELLKKMKEKEKDQTYDFEIFYYENFIPQYEGINLFNNDDTIGFFNEINISPATIKTFYVETNKKYSIIDFTWSIEDYDITCKITNENEDKIIYDGYKKSSYDTPIKFILFETEPIKYKIIFDNYYSWFTSKKIKYKINIFYPEYPFYISKKIAYSHFREQLINQGNTEDFYEHLDKICKINYLNNKSFNAGYIYNNIARLQEMLNEGIVSIYNIYIDITQKKFYNENFESFVLDNDTFENYIKDNLYLENIFNICNIYNISKEQIRGNDIEDFLGFNPQFKNMTFQQMEFVIFFCSNLSDTVLLTNLFKKTFNKDDISNIVIQLLYIKNIGYQIAVYKDQNLLINNEVFNDINVNESLEKNVEVFKNFFNENKDVTIEINILSNDEQISSLKIGNSIKEIVEDSMKKNIKINLNDSDLFFEASNTGEVFQLK